MATSKKNGGKIFTYRAKLLELVAQKHYANDIAKKTNSSKQRVYYHLKQLEQAGYIEKEQRSSIKTYKLTRAGINYLHTYRQTQVKNTSKKSSPRVREGDVGRKPRTHHLKMNFPILQDNKYAQFEKETAINNWIKQFERVPFGVTIEKTPQNIIAHFHKFHTSYTNYASDFFQQVFKAAGYVHAYLAEKKQIKIDMFNATILSQHTANTREEHETQIDPKTTYELDLNRPAQTIWPNTMQAKAWIDRSHGNVEIETNDMEYEEKLLLVPERIEDIHTNYNHAFKQLAANLNMHLAVMQKISDKLDKL